MAFTQFTLKKQLIKRFASSVTLSNLGVYNPPSGYTLVNVSTYIENLRVNSYIRALAVTNTNDVDNVNDPDEIRSKLIDILFHSPRKQLDISIISEGITTLLGSLSLINNGFPYNFNDLSDIINNRLSLDNITNLKLDFQDVGYGLIVAPDYCLLQGDIVQEITLFKEVANITNIALSPVINLTVTGGGNIDPEPEPEPEPPTPTGLEEIMRIIRTGAWYQNIATPAYNWYNYPANYLSISAFQIEPGYRLSDIAMLIIDAPDGNFQNISYVSTNIKLKVWEDLNGSPDFSKPLGDTVLTLTRNQDSNTQLLSWNLSTPITGKELVWIGFKSQDKLTQTIVNAGEQDFNLFGYKFPTGTTNHRLSNFSNVGYAVPNCPYSDDWSTSYTLIESGSGFDSADESPIMFLGKLSKITA